VSRALGGEAQDLDVLTDVASGTLEGNAVHLLDHDLLGAADPQGHAFAQHFAHGARLARQGERVEEIARDHRGAELDARRRFACGLQGDQGVEAPGQVGNPTTGESELLGPTSTRSHFRQVGRITPRFTDEDPNAHATILPRAPGNTHRSPSDFSRREQAAERPCPPGY